MDLLKAIAQFLVVLVVGYLVAVAMSCVIGGGCPHQNWRPTRPSSTGSWQSAPPASRYAPSPGRWSTAFRRYRRSSRKRTSWTVTPIGRLQRIAPDKFAQTGRMPSSWLSGVGRMAGEIAPHQP